MIEYGELAMERTKDLMNKTILFTGTFLIIVNFSSFVALINTSIDQLTGISCVISAFSG